MTGRVVFCYQFSKSKGIQWNVAIHSDKVTGTCNAMKVIERVFKGRIREKVEIDAMQFGFMPGKGTTDAIFLVRQMQEKYGCKGKKLYFALEDLKKAFDRVPTDVTSQAPRKAGVEE